MNKKISSDTLSGWGKLNSGGMERFTIKDGKTAVAVYYKVNLETEYTIKGELISMKDYLFEHGYKIPDNVKQLKFYSFMLDEMLNEDERFSYSVVDFPFARGIVYDIASTTHDDGEEESSYGMRQLETILKALNINFGCLDQNEIDNFFQQFNTCGDTWVFIEGHGHTNGGKFQVGEQNPNPLIMDKTTRKLVRVGAEIKNKINQDPKNYKLHPLNMDFSVGNIIQVEALLEKLSIDAHNSGVSITSCNLENVGINYLYNFPVSYIYGDSIRPKTSIINPRKS
jgi:hypothetical protein